MNLLHMKYAVEVARCGSLSKASEVLLIAQPNISRSVKELERDLGITIFHRSARGMTLTPEGEEFIRDARDILTRIDSLEGFYRGGSRQIRRLSVSAPHARYVSSALAEFSRRMGDTNTEICYEETDAKETLGRVLGSEYSLGILRYPTEYGRYYEAFFEEKGLVYETIASFPSVLLMHKDHPLASAGTVTVEMLSPYIEIRHGDPYVPFPIPENLLSEAHTEGVGRRILVSDRAGKLELLSENPHAFTWDTPTPRELLDRYDLVQRTCAGSERQITDVLIYQRGYRLTKFDREFITLLNQAKEIK